MSHSNQPHTTRWLHDVLGRDSSSRGSGGDAQQEQGQQQPTQSPAPPALPDNLDVEVDEGRGAFAAWGLGVSSLWHVLSPRGLYDVYRLAREEGIANRPTESGYRWQTSGSWAVDARGRVVWGGAAGAANEIPNFEEAVRAVQGGG